MARERSQVSCRGLLKSVLVYVDRRGTISGAVLMSVAFRLVATAGTYSGFRALNVDIPLGSVLFVVSVINLVSLVPVSINGWGLREGAFVLLFTQIGVGSAEAFGVALLGRVLGVLFSSVGGVLYITQR